MESENESSNKESNVKELQASLFPTIASVKTISPTSFFSNFLFKPTYLDDDDNQDRARVKGLFAINRDPQYVIQPPRWPTECQVYEDRITHIPYSPSTPESYYVPTGKEIQPKPVGEECGIVVYQYHPISAVNYFSRSSVGGSKYLLSTCPAPEEDGLRFESRFESGNLAKVIKITATYYELYLRTDLYTNRHMQWFYFRVTNMRKHIVYRLSLVNLTKEESLFNEGMKPLLYSSKNAQLHSIGWQRCGDNITYFCNENVGPDEPDQQMTYTLTFTLEFPHDDDTVYLAYSCPYTYSDLQDYLAELSSHPVKSTFSTLRILCRTLAGNNVHYITVTAPQTGECKKKKAIVVTARVHPGESPASWMMKGFLDFLTGDSGPAKELREKFIFKLVPMLNPDGVIVGNNRCSLTGKDLNRQYRTVIRETYPAIYYTKLMVRRLIEECGVGIYCDLHAHSRKHNIFIYGCENRRGNDKHLHEQIFPLMLHKNAADKFSFEDCKFRVQRSKEGTGRVVMWMMGIGNSYTLEASFGGTTMGTRADTHFSTLDYEQMGRSFCQTLLDYYDDDPRKGRLRLKIVNKLVKGGSNADEPTNIELSDYSSDIEDTSSSSSDGEGCDKYNISLIVPPPSPILPKKHKKKEAKSTKPLPKSPTINRRLLPMYKATLGFSLPRRKAKYTSDSSMSSDCESDSSFKGKVKPVRRKKMTKRKQKSRQVKAECKSPPRSLSVLDLLPSMKPRSQSWHRLSNAPQPKLAMETKSTHSINQQLAEVQVRLLSLKNRLWLGVGGGDMIDPLSWGLASYPTKSEGFEIEKRPKKKSNKQESSKKKSNKKAKEKEAKEVSKKPNGLRRQKAVVEWMSATESSQKMRKSKSLSDAILKAAEKSCHSVHAQSCDEDNSKTKPTKKKKKKSKFQKKSKAIAFASAFIGKD